MGLIQLDIKGISYSQTQSGAYALVLIEEAGKRTLPIIIGAFEAQSIAIALEKEIKPPRPLTHDLFLAFSERFQITISKVIIHKLVDGVFFSSLVCNRNGIEEILDARTSDAIALAIRFSAPIFTYETILESAGIYLTLEDEETNMEDFEIDDLFEKPVANTSSNPLENLSLKDLNTALLKAIEKEDYEAAALLRDEIGKR
jgi:bifunctional DNase/RNase